MRVLASGQKSPDECRGGHSPLKIIERYYIYIMCARVDDEQNNISYTVETRLFKRSKCFKDNYSGTLNMSHDTDWLDSDDGRRS